jgi:hypothetical protein
MWRTHLSAPSVRHPRTHSIDIVHSKLVQTFFVFSFLSALIVLLTKYYTAESVDEVSQSPRSNTKSYVISAIGFALVLCATLASGGASHEFSPAVLNVAPLSAEAQLITTEVDGLKTELSAMTPGIHLLLFI